MTFRNLQQGGARGNESFDTISNWLGGFLYAVAMCTSLYMQCDSVQCAVVMCLAAIATLAGE